MIPSLASALVAIEAAYRVEHAAAWLEGLVAALEPLTELAGFQAMLFSPPGPDDLVGPPLSFALRGPMADRLASATTEMLASSAAEFESFKDALGACFRGDQGPAFTQTAVAPPGFFESSPLGRLLTSLGIADQAILASTNGGAGALLLIGFDDGDGTRAAASVPCLSALAPHASAAARLVQRALTQAAPEPEARLTPDGCVLDAQPPARSLAARERLGAAVRDAERARGRLARLDPEAALRLRVALVSGRWSLVDHWESGVARHWLAMENAPLSPPGPARLTPRQRTVLGLFARGFDDSAIARELGIRAHTVATHLRDAACRLRVRGRTGLLAALAEPQHVLASDSTRD